MSISSVLADFACIFYTFFTRAFRIMGENKRFTRWMEQITMIMNICYSRAATVMSTSCFTATSGPGRLRMLSLLFLLPSRKGATVIDQLLLYVIILMSCFFKSLSHCFLLFFGPRWMGSRNLTCSCDDSSRRAQIGTAAPCFLFFLFLEA